MKPLVIILLLSSIATAQVSVSSPTGGNYRIGQYVAVTIEAPAGQQMRVEGKGLLPLVIEARGQRVSGTFPMLVLDWPGDSVAVDVDGTVTTVPLALREVGTDERVVGVAGYVMPLARDMFPGKSVVPIQLDSARPLAGSPALWDVLDGVVVDGAGVINEVAVRFLLATGVKFAVTAPDPMWPWKRDGQWWRLEYEALGPKGMVGEAAYAPVRNWRPGALVRTRYNVVILGVLFAIFAVGASLLRGMVRTGALILVVLGATAAFTALARVQPPLREAGGGVVVISNELVQSDIWEYQTAVRETSGVVAWNGLTRPMPTSAEHARALDLHLVCQADGRPILFRMRPSAGKVMAFFFSGVNPRSATLVPAKTTSSPMRMIAREFYEGIVIGEGVGGDSRVPYRERWASVIIERTTDPGGDPGRR